MKKLDVHHYALVHLTLILLLHYLVKCRSRSIIKRMLYNVYVFSNKHWLHYITLHYINEFVERISKCL